MTENGLHFLVALATAGSVQNGMTTQYLIPAYIAMFVNSGAGLPRGFPAERHGAEGAESAGPSGLLQPPPGGAAPSRRTAGVGRPYEFREGTRSAVPAWEGAATGNDPLRRYVSGSGLPTSQARCSYIAAPRKRGSPYGTG